jgi:SseB protein N-terminal domain
MEDDGSAPEHLIEAIRRFHAHELGEAEVVDAIRQSRLLVPLVTEAGAVETNERGQLVEKTQELSIVTVAGPDGRTVLPAFSSVDSMRKWNALARPIPVDAVRVALAAASEKTDLVLLDPTSETEFTIRRPALWAIAQSKPWIPSYLDEVVYQAFVDASADEPAVLAIALRPGDPTGRNQGPELSLNLTIQNGLDKSHLDDVIERMRERWSLSTVIAERVDSLAIRVLAAD